MKTAGRVSIVLFALVSFVGQANAGWHHRHRNWQNVVPIIREIGGIIIGDGNNGGGNGDAGAAPEPVVEEILLKYPQQDVMADEHQRCQDACAQRQRIIDLHNRLIADDPNIEGDETKDLFWRKELEKENRKAFPPAPCDCELAAPTPIAPGPAPGLPPPVEGVEIIQDGAAGLQQVQDVKGAADMVRVETARARRALSEGRMTDAARYAARAERYSTQAQRISDAQKIEGQLQRANRRAKAAGGN